MSRPTILLVAIATLLLSVRSASSAGSEVAEQSLGRFRVRISWVTFVPYELATSVEEATNATHYLIGPGEIVVRYPNAGLQERRVSLTPEQSKSIHSLLQTVTFDKRTVYQDLSVSDWFAIACQIQVDDGPMMNLTLWGVWQNDVVALCRELNALLPAEFAIPVPDEARKAS